jgi:tetratricopeptide (TPR) repeat protein
MTRQSDLHIRLGHLYASIGQPTAAVRQYSKWIDSHPQDSPLMATVLNSRCWSRALSGQELPQAVSDCNAALKMRPHTAQILETRGLVYLRQNNYDKAIADYDTSLRLNPKSAWSLYGRGLAKQRKGLTAAAQADIAAATALEPKIAEQAAKYGLTP